MKQYSASSRPSAGWVVASVALGALAMYLADPDRGRRRRALVKDKMKSVAARGGKAFDVATRDLGNRAHGWRAQARHMIGRGGKEIDDDMLVAHVRQKMGRATSHARAIHVAAEQGVVTLSGPVLTHEAQDVLDVAHRVAGVREVVDELQPHDTAENISSLQGSGRVRGNGTAALRENWTPASRVLAALGGGTLGMMGLARHTRGSMLLGAAGLGLMMRGMTNTPLKRLAERRSGRPGA